MKAKTKQKVETLQTLMEANQHLKNPEIVEEHLSTVLDLWPYLTEWDQIFVQEVKVAIIEGTVWNV